MDQEVRRIRDTKEERRRGLQLVQAGNLHMDQELIEVQTLWGKVQRELNLPLRGWGGVVGGCGRVPPGIQAAVQEGERQATHSRQALRLLEQLGPQITAQFWGHLRG